MKNREIKFRVWEKSPINHGFPGIMIDMDYIMRSDYLKSAIGGEYPIMQYTGLKDKNGVEIYEGDIVHYETTEGSTHSAIVNYNNELCCVMIGQMPYIQLYQSAFTQPSKCDFLIIGNIYQKPELLPIQIKSRT